MPLIEVPLAGEDSYSLPVHNGESSLPTADEARVDTPKHSSGKHCFFYGVLTLIVLVAFIVGVTIGVQGEENQVPLWPTPPIMIAVSKDDVVNFLVDYGASSRVALDTVGSPQNLALTWLVDEDELPLAVPEDMTSVEAYHYVSRYVMAVFWYSTNGASWKSKFDFMSNRDICLWNDPVTVTLFDGQKEIMPGGVYCKPDTGVIDSVYLGEFKTATSCWF